jgi:predicted amidophosphoribosyltransferase
MATEVPSTMPAGRLCEACGQPLDSGHRYLCGHCADTIDRDTEALLEREHFDGLE